MLPRDGPVSIAELFHASAKGEITDQQLVRWLQDGDVEIEVAGDMGAQEDVVVSEGDEVDVEVIADSDPSQSQHNICDQEQDGLGGSGNDQAPVERPVEESDTFDSLQGLEAAFPTAGAHSFHV